MVSKRAQFLLDEINNQLNAKNPHAAELIDDDELEQEQTRSLDERENNIIMAKYKNRQQQHQNERVDNDKKRVRDAERVLGRRAYLRARERVYEA